ncbi:hypothetical protein [Fictibacillus terranigra]|uniref:Coat F domain-containing protein n=1 Tax=Fictibacillus terranigra TaxID=3058424 RepID=A0ABT8E2F9_9BACL|nr:hypothetical protein [Fictibacillus sp. CENA-BCM004]MDN4072075.1 hypothetical protein [Fictibacillus sp. CENA-BCM004]
MSESGDKTEVDERLLDRELGQLQLHILKGLLEKEAKSISNMATHTSAESQFLLGKEEGINKAQEMLTELIDKTSSLYKPKRAKDVHLIPKNTKKQ